MLTWMIFVYAINTHQPLPSPAFNYFDQQVCKIEAKAIEHSGLDYATCKPVIGKPAVHSMSNVRAY
jgi:hypothetical protein